MTSIRDLFKHHPPKIRRMILKGHENDVFQVCHTIKEKMTSYVKKDTWHTTKDDDLIRVVIYFHPGHSLTKDEVERITKDNDATGIEVSYRYKYF